jgi:hypothetical protein
MPAIREGRGRLAVQPFRKDGWAKLACALLSRAQEEGIRGMRGLEPDDSSEFGAPLGARMTANWIGISCTVQLAECPLACQASKI